MGSVQQPAQVQFHSQDNLRLTFFRRYERLDTPFAIARGITLPLGAAYTFHRYRLLIVGLSAGDSLAGQSPAPANVEKLNAQSEVLLPLARDLLQMGTPTTRNLDEFEVASALSASADTASDYFDVATDLLINSSYRH